MLRLEAVSKRYGRGAAVLIGVDLDVPAGAIVAIKGGNGSGKSTLLRIAVGVSTPSTGVVTARPTSIGYVPERFPPDERLSASAYLEHMGRIRGLSSAVAVRRTTRLLERLALTGDASAPLRRLSKGNAQKVAVAQALLVAPQLLVLDEPWSGLDTAAHGVVAEVMAQAAESGAAVLYTSHGREPTSMGATSSYELAGGRLEPQVPAAAPAREQCVAEVVLSPGTGASPGPERWWSIPGVLEARHDGETLLVRVTDEHCDTLLFEALSRSWSVLRLRRVAASRQEDAGATE